MNRSDRAPTVPQRAPGTVASPETSVPLYRGGTVTVEERPEGRERVSQCAPESEAQSHEPRRPLQPDRGPADPWRL